MPSSGTPEELLHAAKIYADAIVEGLPIKKISRRRVAQLCYPKNVQRIWDNLFFGSP
ncbi:hypothetical protein H6H01_16540 [Nostoc calcicola FACHB-3891]|nr:hypothetical protein [Nostoc calcicola FACHB-3891]